MLLKLMKARKAVPQKLLDTCAFIEDLIGEDAWQAKLKKNHKLLTDVFSKTSVVEGVLADELR
jgi:hypothetical protein